MTATWRIEAQPAAKDSLLILHVLNCHRAWEQMTPRLRDAVRGVVDGHLPAGTHRRVLQSLVEHGIATEDGSLTDAGKEVHHWRPVPKEGDDA